MLEERGLIVSCQAKIGSPLKDAGFLAAVAMEVLAGGASALRLAGSDCITAVRARTARPIIGLIKTEREGFAPRITCTVSEIANLAESGADLVAIDSTDRNRPEPLEELFAAAKTFDLQIFADIATLAEGERAVELGADYVATTMAGYTEDRAPSEGPDFELLINLVENLSLPIILEGRVNRPKQVSQAFDLGAFAVVVGRAITSPRDITTFFTESTSR